MNHSGKVLALLSAGFAACSLHAGLFVGPDSGVAGVEFSSTAALKFTVSGTVDVTALDAFVDNGTALTDTIHVRLLDSSDNVLASVVLDGSSALANGRWAEAPVSLTLGPGTYAITGDSFVHDVFDIGGGANPVYNTAGGHVTPIDTFFGGAGLAIFTGGGWNEAPGGVNGERAVNFEFTAVPEPTTFAIAAGLGLVGFGLWRRKAVK